MESKVVSEQAKGPTGSPRGRRRLSNAARAWLVLGSLVALAGLFYGFVKQPQPADPFAPPENALMAWLSPVPGTELAQMEFRPLGPPATGWAPRSWAGDQHARWLENRAWVRIDHDQRPPTIAIWGDEGGALLGADGWLYRDGQPPVDTAGGSLEGKDATTATNLAAYWPIGTPMRHEGVVTSIAFSPDGRRIVTGADDGAARIWFGETGMQIGVPMRHVGGVTSVAFSPDGRRVATGTDDGTARVWESETGKPIGTPMRHKGVVNSVAFSPDGRRIATGAGDEAVWIWDTETHKQIGAPMHHAGGVRSFAFSQDGRQIVTGSADGTAMIWDTETGDQIDDVPMRYERPASFVYFSPDFNRIATGSADGKTRIWDTETGNQIGGPIGDEHFINSVVFSPDGSRIATGSLDGTLQIWDTKTGKELGSPIPNKESFHSVAFSPDDSQIAIGSKDGMAAISEDGTGVRTALRGAGGEVCWPVRLFWSCEIPLSLALLADHEIGSDGPMSASMRHRVAAKNISYVATAKVPKLTDGSVIQTAILVPGAVVVAGTNGALIWSDRESGEFQLLRDPQPDLNLTALRLEGDTLWVAGTRARSFDPLVLTARALAGWMGVSSMAVEPLEEVVVLRAKFGDLDNAPFTFTEPRYSPARWAFAWAVPAILLLSYTGLAFVRQGPRNQGIVAAATADRPIGWNDRDVLDLQPVARALSRFIRNVETQPPLTIAVTGGWGTGKSSLMNLVQEDLRKFGARPVWFNAWHHRQEEHLLAALLSAIRKQVTPPAYTIDGIWFRLRLLWMRLSSLRSGALALLVMAAIFAAVLSRSDGAVFARFWDSLATMEPPSPDTEDGLGQSAKLALGALAKFVPAVVALTPILLALRKMVPFKIDPAQLMSDLRARASVRDFRDKLDFRHDFGEAFGEVCAVARTRRNPGVVILIDDLDRCPPGSVLSIMESMNYLVSSGRCVIILGIDRDQIEHAVGLSFKDIVDGLPDRELSPRFRVDPQADAATNTAARRRAYASRYLEKLINIEVEVPRMQADDAEKMFAAESEPDSKPQAGDPRWYASCKTAFTALINLFLSVGPAAIVGLAVALAASWMLETGYPETSPAQRADGLAEQPRPPMTPSAPVPDAASGAEEPDEKAPKALAPTRLTTAAWKGISPNGLLWWGGSALLVALSGAWLGLRQLRRRIEIEEDSQAFANALQEVAKAIHPLNPTPRASRQFQNRMRYIAAREDAAANPHPPDLTDRLFRPLLPPGRFKPRPLPIDEKSLVFLGAEQAIAASGGTVPDWMKYVVEDRRRQEYLQRWA